MKKITIGKENRELKDQPVKELLFRLALIRGVLKLFCTDPYMSKHPLRASGEKTYKKQLELVRAELIRRGKLPRTVVGLKTASLDAEIPKP